jgi:riboflavin kinase/FMN adenylyltransferase
VQVIRDLSALPQALRGGAVAIGNFDGVHLGHARIIERLIAAARAQNGPAIVFTFDPHPVRLLRPAEAPPPLTWTERKAELLGELGVAAVIAYPTDEALLRRTAREFFDWIVCERLAARAMVEGPNFHFGRDRAGNVEVLRQFAQEKGIALEVVPPLTVDGEYVSSSRVRRLIGDGDVDAAQRMLTRPYRVRGMVTHGAGRGARIGFPTANLAAIDTLMPGLGVYAGRSRWRETTYAAAINVGPNPTFGESQHKLEVHLIGHQGPLYGEPLEVDFLARLRDIQPFDGVEALVAQLKRDIAKAEQIASADN